MNKDYLLISISIELVKLKLSLGDPESPIGRNIQNILDFILKNTQ